MFYRLDLAPPRPTLLVGWEVRPSLSVSQNADRSEVLLLIQRYFDCGTIRPDRSDRTLKWEVRRLPYLIERIIPHFRTYPMLSSKQRDTNQENTTKLKQTFIG